MLDKHYIGHSLTPFDAMADVQQLRFFAKATGQNDPLYSDVAAARAAGYPGLPLPPTFLFCLDMAAPNPAEVRQLLGIDLAKVLHGHQSFVHHRMAFAGERLRFQSTIADIYDKKNGMLEFVVIDTDVTDERGALVAQLRKTIVVRHPPGSQP